MNSAMSLAILEMADVVISEVPVPFYSEIPFLDEASVATVKGSEKALRGLKPQ